MLSHVIVAEFSTKQSSSFDILMGSGVSCKSTQGGETATVILLSHEHTKKTYINVIHSSNKICTITG